MKFFNWLVRKEGKVSLSTLGVATAGVVAAVGGYLALAPSTSVNPNTVFSSGNEAELVYVNPNASGVYDGVAYGSGDYTAGGERASSIKVSTRSLRLMEQDAQQQPVPSETQELDKQENQVEVFAMDGAKTGLGMGKNAAADLGGAEGSSMSDFQQKLADMQATLAQQQGAAAQAAEQAAKTAEGEANSGQAKTGLKSSGIATAGGSNLQTDAFGPGKGMAAADQPKSSERKKDPSVAERGASQVKYSGGRDAVLGALTEYKAKEDREDKQIYKMTAENKDGYAVRDYYLAATRHGGGLSFTGTHSSLGGGDSSDLEQDVEAWATKAQLGVTAYEKAQQELRDKLENFANKVNTWYNWAWRFCRWMPGVDVVGLTLSLIARASIRHKVNKAINAFEKKWGGDKDRSGNVTRFVKNARLIRDAIMNIKSYYFMTGHNRPKRNYEKLRAEIWPDAA